MPADSSSKPAHPEFTNNPEAWPELHLADWKDTQATLHMWTQIVGKIRLGLAPRVNHWWEVPLYVSTSGLTTSPMPYARGVFEIEFDFLRHGLSIRSSEGESRTLELRPRTVADFYKELMATLQSLGIDVRIWPMPQEVPDPVRFDQDVSHASYNREQATRFWKILLAVDDVFKEFRGRFVGKDSPVHFFWGSFDLAVTRFSGRRAPERVGADPVTREAYSHEVISAGFWPGGGDIKDMAFYAYAAPEPEGLGNRSVRPASAFYNSQMHEFFLMYEDVRKAASPRDLLLEFLESTYEAAAELGQWDRAALEKTKLS
jgi:hypothetical protein